MFFVKNNDAKVLMAIVAAARASLLGGEHDGPCTNTVGTGRAEQYGPCQTHRLKAAQRQDRLRKAIEAWDALP